MEKGKKIWNLCGGYLLLILCGAVLVLLPNSAVALVTKILAWFLVAAGIYNVIKNLTKGDTTAKDWLWTVLYLGVGGYMLVNPMAISDLVGRILGTLLMIQGLNDLRRSSYESAKFLGALAIVGGMLLVVIPRTLVNTLLALVGLVLIVIGIINCVGKLRHAGKLEEGSDPNIIDAEP